jgi:hypothetical protein
MFATNSWVKLIQREAFSIPNLKPKIQNDMIDSPQQPPKMPVEEYLEWELQQDFRYEYVNGEVFAMTGEI